METPEELECGKGEEVEEPVLHTPYVIECGHELGGGDD
jgi:hypothetical protein